MKALFIELPPFERLRQDHLTDDEFRKFQLLLLANPMSGDVIQDTGGLRKIRFEDKRRGKGKRSGIRVIYYWYIERSSFLLITLYDKDTKDLLTVKQKKVLKELVDKIRRERKNGGS